MKFWNIMLLVGIMMIMDCIVIGALLNASVQALFEPMSKRFPPKEMKGGAIEKSFQSLKVGMLNYGFSVHLGVDDAHLHVVPVRIFRWCGAKPSSVPLGEVIVKDGGSLEKHQEGKLIDGKIGGIELKAPAWVFREALSRTEAREASVKPIRVLVTAESTAKSTTPTDQL